MDTASAGQSLSQTNIGGPGRPDVVPFLGETDPGSSPKRQDGTGLPPDSSRDRAQTTGPDEAPHEPDPATVRADITVRSSEAFTSWVAGVAADQRVSMATLIELALVRFAKAEGYVEPPTRIPVRPATGSSARKG